MKSSLLLVLTKKISVLFIFFSTLKFKNNRGNDVNNIISPPEIQYILQLTFNRFNRKINIELKIIPNPIPEKWIILFLELIIENMILVIIIKIIALEIPLKNLKIMIDSKFVVIPIEIVEKIDTRVKRYI